MTLHAFDDSSTGLCDTLVLTTLMLLLRMLLQSSFIITVHTQWHAFTHSLCRHDEGVGAVDSVACVHTHMIFQHTSQHIFIYILLLFYFFFHVARLLTQHTHTMHTFIYCTFSFLHFYTHTKYIAHFHTHFHTHTLTHTQSHAHTHTHSHTLITLAHTHTHTLTHTHSHDLTHFTLLHTHTHFHTFTLSHSHHTQV